MIPQTIKKSPRKQQHAVNPTGADPDPIREAPGNIGNAEAHPKVSHRAAASVRMKKRRAAPHLTLKMMMRSRATVRRSISIGEERIVVGEVVIADLRGSKCLHLRAH